MASIPTAFDPLGTLGAGEHLPSGWTRLNYISSAPADGAAGEPYSLSRIVWVDGTPTTWELKMARPNADGYAFCGFVRESAGITSQVVALEGSTALLRFSLGASELPKNVQGASLQSVGTYRLEYDGRFVNRVALNGVPVAQNVNSNSHIWNNFCRLGFCRRYSTIAGWDTASQPRIYRSRIWRYGELVEDVIPARSPEGVACLFDLVTQTPLQVVGGSFAGF